MLFLGGLQGFFSFFLVWYGIVMYCYCIVRYMLCIGITAQILVIRYGWMALSGLSEEGDGCIVCVCVCVKQRAELTDGVVRHKYC